MEDGATSSKVPETVTVAVVVVVSPPVVWEWTSGWYHPYPDNNQENELFGKTLKVVRGGSWHSNMDLARTAIRGKALPDQRQNYIGFRCIKRL